MQNWKLNFPLNQLQTTCVQCLANTIDKSIQSVADVQLAAAAALFRCRRRWCASAALHCWHLRAATNRAARAAVTITMRCVDRRRVVAFCARWQQGAKLQRRQRISDGRDSVARGRGSAARYLAVWIAATRNRQTEKCLLHMEVSMAQVEKLVLATAAAGSAAQKPTSTIHGQGCGVGCAPSAVNGETESMLCNGQDAGGLAATSLPRYIKLHGNVRSGAGTRDLQVAVSALRGKETQRKEQLAWKRWQAAAQDGLRAAWREWADYAIAFADLLQFPRASAPDSPASIDCAPVALTSAGGLDGANAVLRMREMIKPLSNDFQVACQGDLESLRLAMRRAAAQASSFCASLAEDRRERDTAAKRLQASLAAEAEARAAAEERRAAADEAIAQANSDIQHFCLALWNMRSHAGRAAATRMSLFSRLHLRDRSSVEEEIKSASGKDAVIRALREELGDVQNAATSAAAAAQLCIAAAEAESKSSKSAAAAAAAAASKEITELRRLLHEAEAKGEQLTIIGKKMREESERFRARLKEAETKHQEKSECLRISEEKQAAAATAIQELTAVLELERSSRITADKKSKESARKLEKQVTSLKASLASEQRAVASLRAAEAERSKVPAPTEIDSKAEADRQKRLIALAVAHERAALLAAAGRSTARTRMESEVSLGRAISTLPADQVCTFGRPSVPRLVRPITARTLLGDSSTLGNRNQMKGSASRSMDTAEMEGILQLKRDRVHVEADAAAKLLSAANNPVESSCNTVEYTRSSEDTCVEVLDCSKDPDGLSKRSSVKDNPSPPQQDAENPHKMITDKYIRTKVPLEREDNVTPNAWPRKDGCFEEGLSVDVEKSATRSFAGRQIREALQVLAATAEILRQLAPRPPTVAPKLALPQEGAGNMLATFGKPK